MLIAPVLPGETMKNLLLQSRVITDPLNHPLIGWHAEYYFFYVKHRDLNDRALFESMVLDPSTDLTSLDSTSDAKTYHKGSSDTQDINWSRLCLDRVTEVFFRGEGEAILEAAIDGLPLANIGRMDFTDSLALDSSVNEPGDVDLTSAVAGQGDGTTAVKASEIDEVMRNYEFLRANNLVQMTYQDFLATYGIRPAKQDIHEPELIRYVRDWTYPTNTVDPATGSPSTACSWTISERADKDRLFTEPGFIFGCQVIRPKVYASSIVSSLTSIMNKAVDWLPAVLADDPWTSIRQVAANQAPITNMEADYLVDIKDLFIHGEQYLNFDPAEVEADGAINVPDWSAPDIVRRYANADAADTLFTTPVSANSIRSDGIVSLNILGRLSDTSPMGVGT
ncbi:MAG: hypothetical protein COB93_08310 [Sneathiella sp.]|nr:MAG: hypothetical protein COB93_08310 [Sneathiella sp.]